MEPFIIVSLLVLVSAVFVTAHDDCGTPKPNELDFKRAERAEKLFFGKVVNDMNEVDSSIGVQSINSTSTSMFQLVNIPIVYHLLPNQDNGSVFQPKMTVKQAQFATKKTNSLYNIYNKKTKTSVQFASFTFDETKDFIVHDDVEINQDCYDIPLDQFRSIVMKSSEWEFKMHVVVCETNKFSGRASFPENYGVSDALHNLVFVDHRALACYDNFGSFICESSNGTNVSNNRWWKTKSVVVAHEFGHLFGLYHTYEGGCEGFGDGVADTPAHTLLGIDECKGLLPYVKDRKMNFRPKRVNIAKNASQCGGRKYKCRNTCAACCEKTSEGVCLFYKSEFESLSDDETNNPICCHPGDNRPRNTCPSRSGIDPNNNVMAYVPDYCVYEFTVGQMLRMMAAIFAYKDFIYCNYGSSKDDMKCASIPCSSTATSPNCP